MTNHGTATNSQFVQILAAIQIAVATVINRFDFRTLLNALQNNGAMLTEHIALVFTALVSGQTLEIKTTPTTPEEGRLNRLLVLLSNAVARNKLGSLDILPDRSEADNTILCASIFGPEKEDLRLPIWFRIDGLANVYGTGKTPYVDFCHQELSWEDALVKVCEIFEDIASTAPGGIEPPLVLDLMRRMNKNHRLFSNIGGSKK